jgi:hypothetical protein
MAGYDPVVLEDAVSGLPAEAQGAKYAYSASLSHPPAEIDDVSARLPTGSVSTFLMSSSAAASAVTVHQEAGESEFLEEVPSGLV